MTKKIKNLYQKGTLPDDQLRFGHYLKKEIFSVYLPDVAIRWIDAQMGWGVFAMRDFKEMEFISEYSGKLVCKKCETTNTSYAFDYPIAPGIPRDYVIDARTQGGVARYINHSTTTPNLFALLVTLDFVNHVILCTKEPILKGAQLSYDYGQNYWQHTAPLPLASV